TAPSCNAEQNDRQCVVPASSFSYWHPGNIHRGELPIAWKLKSNRVSSPSHTVECFTEVMIRHGFLGRTNCASSRLKLTNQWQAACLQYFQYCGLRPLCSHHQPQDSKSNGY